MNEHATPPDLPEAAGAAVRLVRVLLGLLGAYRRGVAWLLGRREELALWNYVDGVLRDFTELLERIAAGELPPPEPVMELPAVERTGAPRGRRPCAAGERRPAPRRARVGRIALVARRRIGRAMPHLGKTSSHPWRIYDVQPVILLRERR